MKLLKGRFSPFLLILIGILVASIAIISAMAIAASEGQFDQASDKAVAAPDSERDSRITPAPTLEDIADKFVPQDVDLAIEATKAGKEVWARRLGNGRYELLGVRRLDKLPDGSQKAVVEYLKYPGEGAPGWEVDD